MSGRGVAVVTGSAGLVGSAACRRLHDERDLHVVGVDNDLRPWFFGAEAARRFLTAGSEVVA